MPRLLPVRFPGRLSQQSPCPALDLQQHSRRAAGQLFAAVRVGDICVRFGHHGFRSRGRHPAPRRRSPDQLRIAQNRSGIDRGWGVHGQRRAHTDLRAPYRGLRDSRPGPRPRLRRDTSGQHAAGRKIGKRVGLRAPGAEGWFGHRRRYQEPPSCRPGNTAPVSQRSQPHRPSGPPYRHPSRFKNKH